MIPMPRPGLRFGDCQECGRQHIGECLLPLAMSDYVMPGFNTKTYLDLLGAGLFSTPKEQISATEFFRRLEEDEALLRAKMERIRWRSLPSE